MPSQRTTKSKSKSGIDLKSKEKPKEEFHLKQREKKLEKNLDNLDALDEQTIDFNELLNLEFQKLSREYREIEDDRHAITGKEQTLKSKRKRMIDIMYIERDDLDADLSNILAPAWEAKDIKTKANIIQIMEEWEEGNEELQAVFREIGDIRERIATIVKKLIAQKLRIQQVFGHSQSLPQVERKRRVLENRLHLFTQKYDTKMYENKLLRVEMDQILKSREVSFKRLDQLKCKIASVRNFINDIVAHCCDAYNERDGFKQRIHFIRNKDARETKSYLSDIVEFERQLNLDKWNYQFAMQKHSLRTLGESEEQRQERKRWMKYKEKVDLLASYKKTFAKILKRTKQKSMEHLLKYSKEREQRNFSKFLLLTDTNYEMLKVKEDVEELVTQLNDLKAKDDLETKNNQAKINEWNKDIKERKSHLEQLKQRGEEMMEELKMTRSLIGEVFQVAGCEYSAVQMLIDEDVTSQNVRIFLKSIEKSILEMKNTKTEYEVRKASEKNKEVALGQITIKGQKLAKDQGHGGPFIPNVVITGQLDDTDDMDSKDKAKVIKPCTYEELKSELTEQIRLQQEALGPEPDDSFTTNLGSFVSNTRSNSIVDAQTVARVETHRRMTLQLQRESKLGSFHKDHPDIVKWKDAKEGEQEE